MADLPEQRKSLTQIVAEVERYPFDAFIFVQECVTLAADRVHGELTPEQRQVAQWMADREIGPEELTAMALEGQIPPEIVPALEKAGGPGHMNRHVTGQQLCHAIRAIALERWGLMARGVLARWNIHRTEDIGAIIFALVENNHLQKQPTDTLEDFNSVFDFREAFELSYRFGVA